MSDSFASPWATAHQAPLSTWFPRKTTAVGCISFSKRSSQTWDRTHVSCIGILQATQLGPRNTRCDSRGENSCLLHWYMDSLPLSHQGNPMKKIYNGSKMSLYPSPPHPRKNFSTLFSRRGGNIKHDATKLLEEIIGKTLSDIQQHFFRSVSQGNRNKNKNEQIGSNQTYKLLQSKGN